VSSVPPKPYESDGRAVGVIGLGKMGSQIAGHLMAAGMPVWGYDLRSAAMTDLASRGGAVAMSPAALAASVDVIITSLPSWGALASVIEGSDGILAGARSGSTVIETSTLTSAVKRQFRDQLEARGMVMLDCPLSGTAAQMAERDVAVYASGDPDALRAHVPLLAAFTRAQYDVGRFGNGSDLKLLSNLLVTVHNVAAAEALVLAERAGLDLTQVLAALTGGAATSRMLELRGPMMVEKDYSQVSASLEEFMKDIALIRSFAADNNSPLPLFEVCARLYDDAIKAGFGASDHAVVAEVVAGLEPVMRGST
jgi:putative dehydrogenase